MPFNPSLFSTTCHTANPDGSGDVFVSEMTGLSVKQRKDPGSCRPEVGGRFEGAERKVSLTAWGEPEDLAGTTMACSTWWKAAVPPSCSGGERCVAERDCDLSA